MPVDHRRVEGGQVVGVDDRVPVPRQQQVSRPPVGGFRRAPTGRLARRAGPAPGRCASGHRRAAPAVARRPTTDPVRVHRGSPVPGRQRGHRRRPGPLRAGRTRSRGPARPSAGPRRPFDPPAARAVGEPVRGQGAMKKPASGRVDGVQRVVRSSVNRLLAGTVRWLIAQGPAGAAAARVNTRLADSRAAGHHRRVRPAVQCRREAARWAGVVLLRRRAASRQARHGHRRWSRRDASR